MAKAQSSLELSSDHTPIIITLYVKSVKKEASPSLHNKRTNWILFKHIVIETLPQNIKLKTPTDVDKAIQILTSTIQEAAWSSTPQDSTRVTHSTLDENVKEKIKNKRKLRKLWQQTKNRQIKTAFNKAAKELKALMIQIENEKVAKYLENLSPTKATQYSLWKATKNIHPQTNHCSAIKMTDGNWARDDREIANAFALHLSNVFKPFPKHPQISTSDDERIINSIIRPQLTLPAIAIITKAEVTAIIKSLNGGKAPGFDLITGKILKELPDNGLRVITEIFNAIFRLQYFPLQWKLAQVIVILKPGKPAYETSSYRPISLLPILSKVLEILIQKILMPIVDATKVIPDHQFGFRKHHSTIEQCNRVYSYAREAMEKKQYCTAAFIDISQAFDKVWHQGLLYKLKSIFPLNIWVLLYSYLEHRYFVVKFNNEFTGVIKIDSGVPQGSVLGPILYTLFTADLPTTPQTYTATYADDTVIMAINSDRSLASNHLQLNLLHVEHWLKKWRIRANETKSVQITFTLKRDTCPPVALNSTTLPQVTDVKYLGLHLDQRLTWKNHLLMKRKQLGLKLRDINWLLEKSSKLSLENKILLYKVMLKPVWTYGIQLWGVAAKSNIDIIQRFQNKSLRLISCAPWYVTNHQIHRDLNIPFVQEEVTRFCVNYKQRLQNHTNKLARALLDGTNNVRRLKRYMPNDLNIRF